MRRRLLHFLFALFIFSTISISNSHASPFAYISNMDSYSVSVIDMASNTVTATIPVGVNPQGLAVNPAGTRAYVANMDSNDVSVIDTGSNTVIKTVDVGSGPMRVAVHPSGSKVYVSNAWSGTVSVIEAATNTVVDTIATGGEPRGLRVNPAGTKVYVTNFKESGSVFVIDTATRSVNTIPVTGNSPIDLAITPDGSKVYVLNYYSNNVSVIDTASDTEVVNNIAVGANPIGVWVNAAGTKVFVANVTTNNVMVIDPATNGVTVAATGFLYPVSIEGGPDGSRLYVVEQGNNRVSVLNAADYSVVTRVGVGTGPRSYNGNFIASPPSVTNGLFSLWRGEGNAFDVVGGNHGTWAGTPAYGAGQSRNAFSFNGSSSHVATGDMDNQELTVSFWFKRNSMPHTCGGLVTKMMDGDLSAWAVYLNGNRIHVRTDTTGSGQQYLESSTVFSSNKWYHIAFVYDNVNVRLYVNGVLDQTQAAGAILNGNNHPVTLGSAANGGNLCEANSHFDGLLDEVQIHNRALTPYEIRSLYDGNRSFEDDPADTVGPSISGWDYEFFTMNDSGTRGSNPTADHELLTTSSRSFSGNKAVYSRIRTLGSYNQDPDYHYATHLLTTDYSAKEGKKLDAVTIWRSDIAYTTSSRWFYWFMVEMSDGANTYSEMLACRDWGGQEGCTNDFQDTHDQSATGTDGQIWYRHRVTVPANLDLRKLKISVRHTERSWDGTSAESSLYYDLLGEETSNGDQTPDLFAFNPVVNAPLSTQVVSDPITVSGINAPAGISISGAEGKYRINSGDWTSASGIVAAGDQVMVSLASSSGYSTKNSATLTIGGVSADFEVTTAAIGDPNATGLVSWWRAENNAYDSIGGNHGAMQNGATFAPGQVGQAFSFDGSDDLVRVLNPQNIPAGNAQRTISAWIRSSGATSGNSYQGIVGYGLPYASLGSGNALFFEWGGDNVASHLFQMNLISGGASASTMEFNNWYHVALTHDGNYTRLFINGRLENVAEMGQNSVIDPALGLLIGSSPPFDSWHANFNGLIDEVKIFNRALTESELGRIYGNVPDEFSFTPVTGAARSATVESEFITVSGTSQPAPISITGGEYVIGGTGSWLSTPSTVSPGANVKVRLTSSSSYSDTKTATLNIGVREGTFTVTTRPDTEKPVVTAFSIAETESFDMTVDVGPFTASDDSGIVSDYLITTSSTPPSSSDPAWSVNPPTTFILPMAGTNTLYAWAKDPAGNVSDPLTDTILLRPVRRGTSSYNYYDSLSLACGEASTNETVNALAVTVPGSVTITGKALTIKGGHADGYGSQNGFTTIQGTLMVGAGSLTVDRVAVR
jgi:YVTN family beta-propeller protein